MTRYEIEYSNDENEVCITPKPTIPMDDFSFLTKFFGEKGYQYWIQSDGRRGYRFVKKMVENDH